MATELQGVDSASRASDYLPGSNTTYADFVKSTPNTPVYWGRYFGPTNNFTPMDMDSGVSNSNEAGAMKAIGVRWIVPIAAPPSVGGSLAQGQMDGTAVCAAIAKVIADTSGQPNKIQMPGSSELYIYLDIESGVSFMDAYWNGWANAVNSYPYGNQIPFYSCAYCNPCDVYPSNPKAGSNPCTTFDNGNNQICFSLWSSTPEGCCQYCVSPPEFAGNSCIDVGADLWQYVEDTGCAKCGGTYPKIDYDLSTSLQTMTDYMLYLP